MRGVIRFFHTAPVVQDQSAGNSGHAVSNLPEGKAVWVEIWIEANLIHIRPVEVIPEETDQSWMSFGGTADKSPAAPYDPNSDLH